MKLIVGLGNPGRRYRATRHNIGFVVLEEVARRCGESQAKTKFHGEVCEADLSGQRALLLQPMTYMNNSGTSVLAAVKFYKIPREDLLVLCDDLNLPLAKLRFRTKGSSGGQKGLEDIIRRLGTDQFSRFRVGIGSPPDGWNAPDYVLGKFGKGEIAEIEDAVARAADAVVDWAHEGTEFCMNRYN